MKQKILLVTLLIASSFLMQAQNLHSDSNAASLDNEANATTGWAGSAVITSDAGTAQSGLYSIRAASSASNGRELRYTFSAIVGQTYNITIWARRGAQYYAPAFANWSGLTGFSTTQINNTFWQEYSFTVVASSTNPIIRAYTSPSSGGAAGDTIYIDSVSILLSDSQAPSTITDLAASGTTSSTTNLSWSAATDNIGVAKYVIFRDGVEIGETTATSYNVTGLTQSTAYAFTVRAEDFAGNQSAVSNVANVTTPASGDTEAPTAVTTLAANNTTSNSTDLSWSASTDNVGVTGYDVYRNGVLLNTTTSTTFAVTGLSPETAYAFTVIARDAAGNSSATGNTVNITTLAVPDTQAPTAPSNLAASNVTENSADLSWTASTDNVGVDHYLIFQNGVNVGATPGLTYAAGTLTPDTAYTFTVIAVDAAGNTSAASNAASITTVAQGDTEPPSTTTDLAASNLTATSVDLNWSPATDNVGILHYLVYVNDGYNGMVMDGTSYTVLPLTPNTAYTFHIIAQDVAGNSSAMSNVVSLTTPADTTAPSAVTSLIASGTTATTTNLSWNASTDNVGIDHYVVLQDGLSIATPAGTSHNVTGLTASTAYDFTIQAVDAAGNVSAAGNTVTVTTDSNGGDTEAPSTVSSLAASNITANSVDLTWNASTDNVGVAHYMVYQGGVNVGLSMDLSYTVTGLSSNQSYSFYVRAMDAAGNLSAVGNTVNVTTVDNGIIDYTSENANLANVDWQANNLFINGNIGIGTASNPSYRLAVAGNVVAEEVRVALQTNWPDYVFLNDYQLPSLKEVAQHIAEKGHLINVPSAKQVEEEGISVGEMNAKLLEKIEELTLYILQQDQKINNLAKDNQELMKRFEKLEAKRKTQKD